MKIKIGHFGLAIQLENKFCKVLKNVGTPNYIAPEIILNLEYSFSVDIWSLGVCIYFLFFGFGPFEMNLERNENNSIGKCYAQIR